MGRTSWNEYDTDSKRHPNVPDLGVIRISVSRSVVVDGDFRRTKVAADQCRRRANGRWFALAPSPLRDTIEPVRYSKRFGTALGWCGNPQFPRMAFSCLASVSIRCVWQPGVPVEFCRLDLAVLDDDRLCSGCTGIGAWTPITSVLENNG